LVTALKYGVGFGLLGGWIWLKWTAPPGSPEPGIADILQRPPNVMALALAAGICLASALLTFVRWFVLVRAQDLPFTLPDAFRLGLIGYFLNTFLPGSIGGDLFKAAAIAREQSRRTVAVATVLVDRAVGLWGLCWLVVLLGGVFWVNGSLAGPDRQPLETIFFGAVGVVAVSVVTWFLLGFLPDHRAERFAGRLSKIPKLGASAAEFWRALWMYRCKGRSVALALVMAMIGHVGFVLTFYFATRVFVDADQIPSVGDHFLLVPVGIAVQACFPTPNGMGGGELAFGYLYRLVNCAENHGFMGSFTQRLISVGLGIVGYLVYLRMRPTLKAVDAPFAMQTAPDLNGAAAAPSLNGPALAPAKSCSS
jgi:uncharacterized protein (TIRG00374 family)